MISEKKLIARMRELYKTAGYRVGNVMMDKAEWLIVAGSGWLVKLPAADAGRLLKAQIVLHTGELPGKPVMVQTESGVQTMIDGELEKMARDMFAMRKDMEPCQPTALTLRGREVWQDENGRCCLFSGDLTTIVQKEEDLPVERITNGRYMILDCGIGAAVIMGTVSKAEEQAQLEHLSQFDWTGGGEE